jgi:hypothetical protein
MGKSPPNHSQRTHPATPKNSKIKDIDVISGAQPATPIQGVLDLGIEVQRDVNGVEMGVLENGIPFLTQRGLAKIVGAHRSVISDISQEWQEKYEDNIIKKDRNGFFGINYERSVLMILNCL